MKISIESTTQIVALDGVPARVWEGTTASGVRVQAFIIVERGWRSFKVPVARLKRSDCQRFIEAWLAFSVAKKALSKETLDRMLYGSAAWQARAQVLMAMALKGFQLTAGMSN